MAENQKSAIPTNLFEELVRNGSFDRKGFLFGLTSSAAVLGLAACGGGAGNSLVPGRVQPTGPDTVCLPGTCTGQGGAYASSGGVDPTGYTFFKQYSGLR